MDAAENLLILLDKERAQRNKLSNGGITLNR